MSSTVDKYVTLEVEQDPLLILDNHIPFEIEAGLFYREAAALLRLTTYSLTGFSEYFREQSKEEFEHADLLTDYLSKRDFEFHYRQILVVDIEIQDSAYAMLLHILELAIEIEIKVYNSFLHMTMLEDISLADVAIKWLHEQEDEVQNVKTLYTKVKESGPQNIYILDQKMHPK